MPIVDDIAGLRRILAQTRTIAVVGLSANWYRPSYFAAKYMQDHGYRIIPVNPTYAEVLGEKCYPSIAAIPGPVDIVDCFRKPARLSRWRATPSPRARRCCGCSSASATTMPPRIAGDAGLDVVMDRCVKIEHARIWADSTGQASTPA